MTNIKHQFKILNYTRQAPYINNLHVRFHTRFQHQQSSTTLCWWIWTPIDMFSSTHIQLWLRLRTKAKANSQAYLLIHTIQQFESISHMNFTPVMVSRLTSLKVTLIPASFSLHTCDSILTWTTFIKRLKFNPAEEFYVVMSYFFIHSQLSLI